MIETYYPVYIFNLLLDLRWSELLDSHVLHTLNKDGNIDAAIQCLVNEAGWRERVVACKLIAYTGNKDMAVLLFQTFKRCPEHYTCHSFMEMLSMVFESDSVIFLKMMLKWCGEDINYLDERLMLKKRIKQFQDKKYITNGSN